MFGLVPFNFGGKAVKGKDPWERFTEAFFDQPLLNPLQKVSAAFSSFKVDVKETADAYQVTADLPGFNKEDITVSYEQKYLTISATHEENEVEEGEKYICKERHSGKIERSFYIDDVEEDHIRAEFKEGVLKISLRKISVDKIIEPQKTIKIE
jgi:HSP20 family protein